MVTVSSASPESSRRSLDESSPRSSRKVSTYGGSRAWSEDEEAYLLEARQCKTPYKHIANHLQKTELACRLHFHQLAYGTKRKRRSPSASSVATTQGSRNPSVPAVDRGHAPQRSIDSTGSRPCALDASPNFRLSAPKTKTSAISPPSSPPPAQRRRLARSESPVHDDLLGLRVPTTSVQPATSIIPSTSTFSPFPGPQSPFPTLPHLSSGHFANHRSLTSPSAFSYTSAPALLPPSVSNNQSRSPYIPFPAQDPKFSLLPAPKAATSAQNRPRSELLFGPSLSASAPPSLSAIPPPSPSSIDPCRLSGIYGRNRNAFWTSVAREYGGNVSPHALEAAFLSQNAASPTTSLPTPPNRSPEMDTPRLAGFDELAKNRNDQAGRIEHAGSRGSNERSRPSSGRDSRNGASAGGASCSIANLLVEDREVWTRSRTA